MQTARKLVVLSGLIIVLMACAGEPPSNEAVAVDRPEEWATPMPETPGLSNFYKVSDELYRGAQPEEEGSANSRSSVSRRWSTSGHSTLTERTARKPA